MTKTQHTKWMMSLPLGEVVRVKNLNRKHGGEASHYYVVHLIENRKHIVRLWTETEHNGRPKARAAKPENCIDIPPLRKR